MNTLTVLVTAAVLLAVVGVPGSTAYARGGVSLSSWMGDLGDLVRNATLLDLVYPGSHDTLTADLSERVADNANDLSPGTAKLLHALLPGPGFGEFIREQATSQALYMDGLLSAGTRFIDFRITYTRGPSLSSLPYDWYGLHFVETHAKALDYLSLLVEWLDAPAHAGEIVVLWFSRHGNTCAQGQAQYPGADPAVKQAFWASVKNTLGSRLINATATPPGTTRVGGLVDAGARVLVYTSDWAEFTGSDPAALDACTRLSNVGYGDILDVPGMVKAQTTAYSEFLQKRADDKAGDVFSLVSLATSSPDFQIEAAAKLKVDPFGRAKTAADCAAGFGIPNMTSWCPDKLLDLSQLTNYYAQIALETAHNGPGYGFPNAFYVDAVTPTGGIRTGSTPLGSAPDPASPHGTASYAYVATMIDWFRIWRCALAPPSPDITVLCNDLGDALAVLRTAQPYARWSNQAFGRQAAWP